MKTYLQWSKEGQYNGDKANAAWDFAEKQKDEKIKGVQKIIAGYMRIRNKMKYQTTRMLLNIILERLGLPKYKVIKEPEGTKVTGGHFIITNELETK